MELLEIVKKLVSFSTVSNRNSTSEIAGFVSELCEKCGFNVNHFSYTSEGEKKVNVLAVKGKGKCRLILSGHMDTVDTNEQEWASDPFQMTLSDQKYYGLGIADMKLFIAIAIKAGEMVKKEELKHPFGLCFTSDEEIGCLGIRKWAAKRPDDLSADFVVIGEPTDLCPVYLHKGYIYASIQIKGGKEKGHSSDPRQGRNVIELALPPIISKLCIFKKELEKINDVRFSPSFPTMNIGKVDSGKGAAKNIISNFCCLEIDIRPLPGQKIRDFIYILKTLTASAVEEIDGIQTKVYLPRTPTPPMETPEDSLILPIAERLSQRTRKSVCYNTEGGIFNRMGCQTIVWGPGSISQAHKPNEFIHTRWVNPEIVNMYSNLIREVCCKE